MFHWRKLRWIVREVFDFATLRAGANLVEGHCAMPPPLLNLPLSKKEQNYGAKWLKKFDGFL